jgi:anaerobic selenocysteine-containing dehydrogenase
MGMMLFIKSLIEAIGSKNGYSATSMDQLPHHFAAHYIFGYEFRIPVPDVDRTDFMIIMGANPLASNGSIMTSAGIRERLRSIKERGGQFVVIDPRKTETANLATSHHFIKPGSDVYFLLAFLHVLYRDGLIDTGDLENHIIDYEKIGALADSVTPDAAEILTDMPAAAIVKLAHDYVAQSRVVLYGRMGLST